jgi:hypothetical protein
VDRGGQEWLEKLIYQELIHMPFFQQEAHHKPHRSYFGQDAMKAFGSKICPCSESLR